MPQFADVVALALDVDGELVFTLLYLFERGVGGLWVNHFDVFRLGNRELIQQGIGEESYQWTLNPCLAEDDDAE